MENELDLAATQSEAAVPTPAVEPQPPAPVSKAAVTAAKALIQLKLDGKMKTVYAPVTGAQLHSLAGSIEGYPLKLETLDGVEVPNDNEPFAVENDQEFTTK